MKYLINWRRHRLIFKIEKSIHKTRQESRLRPGAKYVLQDLWFEVLPHGRDPVLPMDQIHFSSVPGRGAPSPCMFHVIEFTDGSRGRVRDFEENLSEIYMKNRKSR